jgi:thymidylate kinase
MKIALTGAHGVGKSTLAAYLQDKLQQTGKQVVVTPEIPRLICEHNADPEYFRRGNNSLAKQTLILLGQVITEADNKHKYDIEICDRTLFDHWAYTLHAFRHELSVEHLEETYEWFIAKHCSTYDKIFYIPTEIKPVDDGIREADIPFQTEIDKIIVGLFNKNNLAFVTIAGSVEKRAVDVINSLNLN